MKQVTDLMAGLGNILPDWIRDTIPVFRYLRFDKIYVQCIFAPADCKPLDMTLPGIEVAFDKFHIGPTPAPKITTLLKWICTEGVKMLARWIVGLFKYKKVEFSFPMFKFVEKEWRKGKIDSIKWETKKIEFSVDGKTKSYGPFDIASGLNRKDASEVVGTFKWPELAYWTFSIDFPVGFAAEPDGATPEPTSAPTAPTDAPTPYPTFEGQPETAYDATPPPTVEMTFAPTAAPSPDPWLGRFLLQFTGPGEVCLQHDLQEGRVHYGRPFATLMEASAYFNYMHAQPLAHSHS